MASVGLILHLGRDAATDQAREIAAWLAREGHRVKLAAEDAAVAGLEDHAVTTDELREGLDLVVTLGGDGSILRAVELIGTSGVPILGVDHGHLGYLTEVKPVDATDAIARALAGDHDIDERMLVATTVFATDGGRSDHLALNEAVLERTAEANTILLRVDLDDEFFTTYAADGLIVAAPTGSTAYAFSARGPIIDPSHRSLLLAPVSPHMLFDRALVLSPETRIRITVDGHRPATVSIDGRRIAVLGDGDAIECAAADGPIRLVSFGPPRFHRVLKAKFGLNDR